MLEARTRLPYHILMKRSSLINILRQSADDILNSLDMRQRRSQPQPLRPGETVEAAWLNTGAYLRKAMDEYGPISSETRTGRPRS